ncbi:MAG: glycerol-3-phosphate dehydrogenase/oxidase [Vulcanimicrobiaceae bacterium]
MGTARVTREDLLAQLRGGFDVLIVGGGATGLGAAVDAASRGYRTALIEAVDFAKATSSRSTKLVHGGVRYLAEGQIGLVREALRERATLRRNAPHLVTDLPFVCPAYRWYEAPYYYAGLRAYDILAGKSSFGASRFLSRKETLARLPDLRSEGLRGSILYHDGQFDDARLAIALARTAIDGGCIALNYVRAVRFIYDRARIAGAVAVDAETGTEYEIRAKSVVNATGIFVDGLRRLDDPQAGPVLSLSRGTHIVLSHERFRGQHAMLVPKTDDGRVVFVIPWHGHVIVGTTDVPAPAAELDPQPSREEIDYIIAHYNRYAERKASRAHVLASFAGLRPLVNRTAASTAALSREHYVEVSRTGLVSIAGGKWTTYRKMAQDAVDTAIGAAQLPNAPCVTERLPLHGIDGSDREELLALAYAHPSLGERIHPRLAYTFADIVYGVRSEYARTLDDVLSRRTRALFLDAAAALEAAPRVAHAIANELRRPPQWEVEQLTTFRAIAERANGAG